MSMGKGLLTKKIEDARKVVREAFAKYRTDEMRISWTGGKDSMVLLWLINEVCKEDGHELPATFCIDEGDMFQEIVDFINEQKDSLDLKFDMIHNSDVSRAAGGELGSEVRVADLNEVNQAEVERLGYDEEYFDYEPESYVGNHLMKTVTMNKYLTENNAKAVLVGIRWDEQEARADETYFSVREAAEHSPAHDRIHPILHFTERDVWDVTFDLKIPYCKLYEQGYRSLGAQVTTSKESDAKAWEQDLENTYERGGRRQDKEHLMEKLRNLGYM